jgi:hypothetical protein
MVSPLVFYQLGFLALLWLCSMLHNAWPNDRATLHQSPSQPASPLHKRSREDIVGDHWCDGVGRKVTDETNECFPRSSALHLCQRRLGLREPEGHLHSMV